MAERCSPVKLPIQIETSCAKQSHCDCESQNQVQSSCDTSCSLYLDRTINSQGTFQNTCCSSYDTTASINIAYLSNVRDNNCDPDSSIFLNPICLDWCDFLLTFYRVNGLFNIQPLLGNSCAISLHGRTYQDTTSTNLRFSLGNYVKSVWATKCETTPDKLNPRESLALAKESTYVRSLITSSSVLSLTLDQAISVLLDEGKIAPADSTHSATIRFVVQYKYCYKPLNVCVLLNFSYITKVPCYKNLNYCDTWCQSYSPDPCNPCTSELKNCINCNSNNIMSYLNKNFNNLENASVTSGDFGHDDESSVGLNRESVKPDDKTFVSLDSSKW